MILRQINLASWKYFRISADLMKTPAEEMEFNGIADAWKENVDILSGKIKDLNPSKYMLRKYPELTDIITSV